MKESSKLVYNLTCEKSCQLMNDSSLYSSGSIGSSIEFKGQRIFQHDTNSSENYYYFQLLANVDTLNLFQCNIKKDPMNIRFHENRSTFLSQHLALAYIKKHNLVNCLINHAFYEQNVVENPVDVDDHIF